MNSARQLPQRATLTTFHDWTVWFYILICIYPEIFSAKTIVMLLRVEEVFRYETLACMISI
jgi:hypothetical protein